ncbi:hypothetical protein QTP88_015813 [Uroleucon formosanum]
MTLKKEYENTVLTCYLDYPNIFKTTESFGSRVNYLRKEIYLKGTLLQELCLWRSKITSRKEHTHKQLNDFGDRQSGETKNRGEQFAVI